MKPLRISYQWQSLKRRWDAYGKDFHALTDLELEYKFIDDNFFNSEEDAIKWMLEYKFIDDNFFNSEEDAIKWMQERVAEDILFCDGDTLILTKMYFT